jgi:predicted metalloprotease with PDZ domain
VAEGMTSYYDELGLYRAGIVSQTDFLSSLEGYINDLENRPGSKVQTLSESSFDAWIKEYRPNENSKNTGISYYAKGLVVSALLDAVICQSTSGKKNLDDLMKLLWQRFYIQNDRGFTLNEFEKAASEVAGKDLTAFFDLCVRSTKQPDYKGIFESLGLTVSIAVEDKKISGATTQIETGRTVVKFLERNTTFYDAGLNVNDELIAINNVRINNDVEDILRKLAYPAELNILINRGGLVQNITAALKPVSRFKISLKSQSNDEKNAALNKWLEKV